MTFGRASQEEQRISSNNSALVNRAYQVLRDPAQRMNHLVCVRGAEVPYPGAPHRARRVTVTQLSLHGVEVLEEWGGSQTDASLLGEIMEIRSAPVSARSLLMT